jgi:catechol 2,3-dioxygenase-like lactoylglutathione lyase family enzyme
MVDSALLHRLMPDVRWMFHATAMGPDYDGIFGPLSRLFGCRVLHRQQLPEPVGRDGGMTWIGDNSIEIGAPYGEGSSVATFVERLGGGMHSVAVQVPDVAATLARLEPLGVEVASRISDEIVFTRSGGTAGLVLEWASHVQDDDPRWGAPVPAFTAEPVVNVERMAFVAAIVRDPARDGERLAEVLDTDLVTYAVDGATDVPGCALDLGDCLLALYPIPPDEATSRAVWGGVYERPRCLALGLTVADQGLAERALDAAGVLVHHRAADGRAVLVDTLPFPIVLTDQLLAGDPRTDSTHRIQEKR